MKVKLLIFNILLLVLVISKIISNYAIGFDVEKIYNSIFVIESYDGIGSGFAISDNTIITNAHVVSNRYSVGVKTYSSGYFNANIAYIDNDFDIALLVINSKKLKPLTLSNNNLKIGDDVYAIGSPKGLDYTLTKGIVSNLNRKIGSNYYIQTDASVNPGNSGGPLLDDEGCVVGINTMKINDTEGINLAIPINEALKRLSKNGIDINSIDYSSNVDNTIENEEGFVDEKYEDYVDNEIGVYNSIDIKYYYLSLSIICLFILIVAIQYIYKSNKNIYHKEDYKERLDFDIEIME